MHKKETEEHIKFPESLTILIIISLKTGFVYSCLAGVSYWLYFPLSNLAGLMEMVLRNLGIFTIVGVSTYVFFSIYARFPGRCPDSILNYVLSALVVFPLYVYSLSHLEGSGIIYIVLKNLKLILLVLTLPHIIIFFVLTGFFARKTFIRFTGLVLAVFFYINISHYFIDWQSIRYNRELDYFMLTGVMLLSFIIYFSVVKILSHHLKGQPWQQHSGLKKSLIHIVVLGVLYILWLAFQGTMGVKPFMPAAKPNILMIVLDTARSDRFSCYGYERQTTPFLDSFCNGATVYRNTIAPAPNTRPSHASIFTGLYPSAHGLTMDKDFLDDRFLTLAEFLSSQGYITIGFSNNPVLNKYIGLAQGFDDFIQLWTDETRNPTLYHKMEWFFRRMTDRNDTGALRTSQLLREWVNRIYDYESPFFLFVNLMECHLGYPAPDRYHNMFLDQELTPVIKNLRSSDLYHLLAGNLIFNDREWQVLNDVYDGDLFYLDGILEHLFNYLDEKSLLDNTIVIITSDHGEHLGEHGMIDHQFSLYEPLLRIPLIIKVPHNMKQLPKVDYPVQLVDLFPTLVDLLGYGNEFDKTGFQGMSLTGSIIMPREFAVAEYEISKNRISHFLKRYPENTSILKYNRSLKSIISGSLKYIWNSNGESELYDLSVDQQELHNLINIRSEQAEFLGRKLTDWLSSFKNFSEPDEERELGKEELIRLKALGYIE